MVEQINSIAQLWWNWMWPMFWQVSLLVIIIAIADLFLRKRVWPQVRYALWLLVLIKLIIPPDFALSTSIVSQIRAHASQKNIPAEPETIQEEPLPFKIASENILPDIQPRIEPFMFPEKERLVLPPELTSPSYTSNPIIVPEKIKPNWKTYLMTGWLAGVVALMFWAVMRYKTLRKRFCIETQKVSVPKWFEPLLNETAKKLKLRNIPKIAFSNNISSPAVFGTFKPVLVLPSDVSLSQKSMEHILLHELAHIKRLDLKVNTLTTLLQIVYWFNPLLFFAGKRLRHLRELCCDATVARILREQTTDYRITIMESARRFFTKPTELGMGLLGLFEDSSSLANRLKWLEKKTWKYRTIQILTTIAVVTLMTFYILPMAKAKKVQAAETSISQDEQTIDSGIDPREQATLTGKIIDTDGNPVGQAKITLYKRYSASHTGNVILSKVGKTITSQNDGTFVFNTQKRLWVMNYRDELGDFQEGLVVVQNDGLALSWSVWDINKDKNIDFTLSKSQSIDGIVVNETGKPVSGAHVQSIIYRGKDSKTSINDWLPGISPIEELETISDNQGRFKINSIPENSYVDFVVKAKGKASVSTYKKELGPEFKAGQKNVRIVLPDEGFIEGKIVDINTGKGIPGVQVIAKSRDISGPVVDMTRFSSSFFEPLACVSNQEGIFKIGSLTEGYYGLTGEIPFKDKIFVEKGKAATDIKVDCKGYVHGYVKDAKGNPIINAEVQIRPPVESINIPKNATRIVTIIHNGKTDENGYYLVTDIGEYYTVGVVYYFNNDDNRGYRHIYTRKEETFEGTQQVDFQFGTFPEGTASLAGEVKDQNGDILTDFYVQLSSREDDPDQTYFSFGLKERLYTKDGKFEYNNLPAGKYHITMNSLDENRQYEFPLFHKITLEKDKTTKELIEVIKKQAYYGRVLFEDGTPVYFDPPPWPNGTGRVAVPDQLGFEADYIPIDKDGYFEAFLKDGQYERIKNGEFEMKISIPSLEIERLGQYANISFPPDKLSTDKSNAGTVKIEKQLNERELNPINAPSLLQKEVPDFNGIEINKNSEKEETKNLTIKGYVTDSLGRSRGNVYIAPEATNIWQGKHSDLQGNYILEDIKPEQKKWVAYSQASGVLGLFTIPDNYDGKPIHVTLDYIYASVEGRVVGEQGQGLRGQQVELLLTTKDGITYIFPSSQRTDSQGNYEIGILPFGSGLKIQARLKTTRDEWKKYHTDIIEIPENQIFIQMPTLVIAVGKPEESDDGKVLVSGQILNEDGKPVSGAKVGLYFDMPEYMSTWVKEVITDDSGQWKRRIPKDYSGLSITLTHPEYIKQSWLIFSSEELRNGTNKITMKKGLLLKGIVKNANGEPVENALVDTGGGKGSTPYGEVMENHTTPRTLSDGSFSVGGLAPETINIVVSAFGYAPKNFTLDIIENMKPIDITLNKGKTYTGQVVDANDNPIEAVHIELDEWRLGNNRNSIVNLTQTDSNGIFKMENLPDEGTIQLYYAKSKSGLMSFRKEIPEDYPEVDKVVMYKVPVFTGKVIDAETEKPITKFTLTSGIKSSGFGDSIDWNKYYKEEIISNTGSFEQKWSGYAISYPFDGLCHLRVEADGYLSETAPPITLGQHYEPAVIRMTKGKPFSGTVTDSEGKPIPGADVGWVGPDSKAFINNGRFDQTGYSKQTDIVNKTGLNGEFKLPPSRDKGLIVVVHENNGYASISSDDFENGSQIKLKPWAKIEGTIISSYENRKEYNVLINTAVSDEELSAKKIRWIFDGTSYSRKDFVINYIPSVPVNICQYINSERMKPVYLEPQPGQTYKVELSDKPEIVSGRIIEPKPLEGKVLPKMNDIEISVNNEQLNNGMTLICFWDFEQRPSRNMITQLSKRIQELEKKGISILTINTSDTEQKVMDDWLKEQNINLKVGRITEDAEKTKFNWGVKSLPWLILTDKNHIVIAEGFNLEDLDEKISPTKEVSKNTKESVIKGKFVSKDDIDFENCQLLLELNSPEKTSREIKVQKDGSFEIPDIPENSSGYITSFEVKGYFPALKIPEEYSFFEDIASKLRFSKLQPGIYEGIEYDFQKLGGISGQIVDYQGNPLAGIWVRVSTGNIGDSAQTDDYGEYFIELIPNRDLTLEVKTATHPQTLYPSETFRINEGQEIVKNIKLTEEKTELTKEKPKVELTGKVVDKNGQPVSGATVYLGNTYVTRDTSAIDTEISGATWEWGSLRPAFLQSGSDGNFRFNLLNKGKTDIWVEHDELGLCWLKNISTDSKNVKLVLEPQPEKIKYSGKVVDFENKPVANAKIYLHIEEGKTKAAEFQSKSDGTFEIEFKPPWAHFRQFILLCTSENNPPAWNIIPYCCADDILIKLKQPSRIIGKVVDSKGKGIANASVKYYKGHDPNYSEITFEPRDEMEKLAPSTTSDSEGNFILEQVPRGSTISLLAGHATHGYKYFYYIPVTKKKVISEDIQLPDGATIEGTIRFADTKQPAKGITVKAKDIWQTHRQATTDNEGKYKIEGLMNSASYTQLMIYAESGESIPEFEGQTEIKERFETGSHLTGFDILLKQSFKTHQERWLSQKGKAVDGPRIVVLDDSDRAFNGKTIYDDTVTMYDDKGQQQWQIKGFNTCQSVGAKHSIAFNQIDNSIWLVEEAGKRLIKMDLDGNILLELENIRPNSLAIDPKTGNLWVLTTEGTIYGKNLVILNSKGEKIKELNYKGFDIAYSEKDDCFWIAGKEVMSINRDYQTENWWPGSFEWVAVSVNINNNDGSVWVSEGRHPQVEGSKDQILILEPDGTVRKKINLDEYGRASIAIDSQKNIAWVATASGILKMNLDGDIIENIPLRGFSIYLEPETGYIWIASYEGIYRLDTYGKLVWSKETPGGSQKWLCAIPD